MQPNVILKDNRGFRQSLSQNLTRLVEQIKKTRQRVYQLKETMKGEERVKPMFPDQNIIGRIERVYNNLEYITRVEAGSFSNVGKANLRRAQAEIQRIRLALLDCLEKSNDLQKAS